MAVRESNCSCRNMLAQNFCLADRPKIWGKIAIRDPLTSYCYTNNKLSCRRNSTDQALNMVSWSNAKCKQIHVLSTFNHILILLTKQLGCGMRGVLKGIYFGKCDQILSDAAVKKCNFRFLCIKRPLFPKQ